MASAFSDVFFSGIAVDSVLSFILEHFFCRFCICARADETPLINQSHVYSPPFSRRLLLSIAVPAQTVHETHFISVRASSAYMRLLWGGEVFTTTPVSSRLSQPRPYEFKCDAALWCGFFPDGTGFGTK